MTTAARDRRLVAQSFVAAVLLIAGILVLIWGLYPVFHHQPTIPPRSHFQVVFPVQQRYADRQVRM